MNHVKIEIECKNFDPRDSFDDTVARILRSIANRFEDGDYEYGDCVPLHDSNGKRVGRIVLT